MKINIPRGMFANKKKLVLTSILITILVISAYGVSAIVNLQSLPDPVDAIISVENKISRLGEGVFLDASNSSGRIKEYLWDFGDGNTSTNKTVVHKYEIPGWYTISLTVYGSENQFSNATAVVGIQQVDYIIDRDMDRNVWLFNGMFGTGANLETGPNIGNPSIDITIHLDGALGNLGYSLRLDMNNIYEETFTATGGTLDYSKRFEPWDLPLEIQTTDSDIDFFIWADEGKWRSGHFHIEVTFPIDALSST